MTDHIARLLVDPQGRWVIAVAGQARHYWLLALGKSPSARAIEIDSQINTGALAGDTLWLSVSNPGRVLEVEPLTGKLRREHPLGDRVADSLVVAPSRSAAFFTCKQRICVLNLQNDTVSESRWAAQVLAIHPTEKYLFARYKKHGGRAAADADHHYQRASGDGPRSGLAPASTGSSRVC